MSPRTPSRYPRRLLAACGLTAVALLGLFLHRWGAWTGFNTPPLIFDTFFGVGGFIMMGGVCGWLWRRRQKDVRALAGVAAAFAVVITVTALRLMFFVRADYDRGRLPFALGTALVSIAVAAGLWWAAARQRD